MVEKPLKAVLAPGPWHVKPAARHGRDRINHALELRFETAVVHTARAA